MKATVTIVGVINNKNCSWMSSWTAYKCDDDMNYEMLIIESMDSDTETRRLSPVAVLGNYLPANVVCITHKISALLRCYSNLYW